MTKQSYFELLIVLVGGILHKLHEYADEQPEPDFIETSEIDYGPSPPPELPPDRPDVFVELIGDPAQDITIIPDSGSQFRGRFYF